MKPKSRLARASIDRLFAEPFTPQWMTEQEEHERVELHEAVTVAIDEKWRSLAEQSRQAIADKYPSKRRLRLSVSSSAPARGD